MSKSIDESLIKNMAIYETVKDLVHCAICSCILIDPQQCVTCDNVFCKVCITDWHKKSKTCPMKCSNFSFKDSRITRNVLSRLIFKCPLKCSKDVGYDDYFTHEDGCELSKIECPCCKTVVKRTVINSSKNQYEEKINELKKEVDSLKQQLNNMQPNPDYFPDIFSKVDKVFITGKGNSLRTVSCKNPCPSKFELRILFKRLKYPGHVSVGLSDKIFNNENKGYLGGDMGNGNWGLAGNGSLGEQGKWVRGQPYSEGDILTISGSGGIISYKVNSSEATKNYSHNMGNKLLYFAISFFYEDDIFQLI
jgi:hypothetical protein